MQVLAAIAVAVILVSLFFGRGTRRADAGQGKAAPKPPSEDACRILDRMKAMATPTLLLAPTSTPGFSKLGGEPDLPAGVAWPEGPEGPLGFLLQIDLAAAKSAGGPDWLAGEGAIHAFHDERWGMRGQVRVVFSPAGASAPLPPPPALRRDLRYPERKVEFVSRTSIPSLDWLGEDVRAIDVSGSELDELADLPGLEMGPGPLHRIGGYPDEIQDEQMALSCEHAVRGLEYRYGQAVSAEIEQAAQSWRLLLQIDSDSKLMMKWGDGGRFYVFIREQDARAGDFSQTVTITQTY